MSIEDCILRLRDGPIELYVPDFNWASIARQLGAAPLFQHLLDDGDASIAEDAAGESLEMRIMSVLDIAIEDFSSDVPLTSYGLDSLSAARLAHALRPILPVTQMQLLAGVSCRDLQRRLDALSEEAHEVVPAAIPQATSAPTRTVPSKKLLDVHATMLNMVHDLSAGLERREYVSAGPHRAEIGDVILLTGTTGSLGTALLSSLASCTGVKRIYAVNRGHPEMSLVDRQRRALNDLGFEIPVTFLSKITFVEASLHLPGLGISTALLKEVSQSRRDTIRMLTLIHKMRSSVTTIIHNAWPVNFNIPLKSFTDSLAATRNLVDLALQSTRSRPARFIFISTFSVLLSEYGIELGLPY